MVYRFSSVSFVQHLTKPELLRLLAVARAENERYWAAILIGFSHGLRVSEIVPHRTKLQGSYQNREKAEVRRKECRGSYIRETTRKKGTGRVLVYQVITPRATVDGGLKPESFEDGAVVVKRLKRSHKTTQPFIADDSDPLLDERVAIALLLKNAKPGKPFFPITRIRFWQIMQQYGRLAHIPRRLAHPHILKRSLGMQNIKKAGIENLRVYMGHKSGASTMEYLKVDDDQASKAMAVAMGTGDTVSA